MPIAFSAVIYAGRDDVPLLMPVQLRRQSLADVPGSMPSPAPHHHAVRVHLPPRSLRFVSSCSCPPIYNDRKRERDWAMGNKKTQSTSAHRPPRPTRRVAPFAVVNSATTKRGVRRISVTSQLAPEVPDEDEIGGQEEQKPGEPHRRGPSARRNASRAAPWTACHGVRSHAEPVALVIECSIPVV